MEPLGHAVIPLVGFWVMNHAILQYSCLHGDLDQFLKADTATLEALRHRTRNCKYRFVTGPGPERDTIRLEKSCFDKHGQDGPNNLLLYCRFSTILCPTWLEKDVKKIFDHMLG